jgi:DNA-binding CsgD family transcriptional regulator
MSGHSEKEVASALGISKHTVHHHTKAIYVEFGVASRAELLGRLLAILAESLDRERPAPAG